MISEKYVPSTMAAILGKSSGKSNQLLRGRAAEGIWVFISFLI
jgi:hypothetical protein